MRKHREPHLTNLNEDPILSNVICHFFDSRQIRVGRSEQCNIVINGLNILSEHAIITSNNGEVTIEPAQLGAKIKVNGTNIDAPRVLEHNDRILFGPSQIYVFIHPQKQRGNEPRVTWEMAQKEIAEAKGFSSSNKMLTKEQIIVQEKIIEYLPAVSEVNAISEELNKYRFFEIILVPSMIFDITKPNKQV